MEPLNNLSGYARTARGQFRGFMFRVAKAVTHSESDSRPYVVFGFVGPAREDLGFRAL